MQQPKGAACLQSILLNKSNELRGCPSTNEITATDMKGSKHHGEYCQFG